MMRSLWSGVSGLQSHQIAMDVESNNIANVNTVGFKYSRVSFADLFSQTSKVATGPDGNIGGRNAMQVGLGTQINATTTIYKQGSLQTTENPTDLALDGDGFFVLSNDGGKSYLYTRNGDFILDSMGNLVDHSGNIVQGWMRNETTGKIDPTTPMTGLHVDPGLSIPAKASTQVSFKGNLDSGDDVGTLSSPIYSLDSHAGWLDKDGNGIKDENELLGLSATTSENDTSHNEFYVDEKDKQIKMREKGVDLSVLFNSTGDALHVAKGQGIWVSYADAKATFGNGTTAIAKAGSKLNIELNGIKITGEVNNTSDVVNLINNYTPQTGIVASVINGEQLQLVNQNNSGTTATSKNIKLRDLGSTDITGLTNTAVITAYQYGYAVTSTSDAHSYDDSAVRNVHTTEDLRKAMQEDARLWVNYNGEKAEYKKSGTKFTANEAWQADTGNVKTKNKNDGVEVTVNSKGQFNIANPAGDAFNENDGDKIDNTGAAFGTTANSNTDADDHDMNIHVTALSNPNEKITANSALAKVFSALNGGLSSGASTDKTSGAITMASFSMTTDIYDSLGSKHTLSVEFRKTSYDAINGSEWSMTIRVPEPGTINDTTGTEYKNVTTGTIRFGPDGSVIGYNPSTLTYSANNGSAPGQSIELNFGTLGAYDGMTSYDETSSSNSVSQDGYTGGTLKGTSVDSAGVITGAFTNGKSMALGQVSVATFTNNTGLESMGGNTFIQTANSGAPVFGTANSGSRGKMAASTLEMSNVDLSRSLTQLIVVQRGYQANSKAITTSDEMLNTLLQLK